MPHFWIHGVSATTAINILLSASYPYKFASYYHNLEVQLSQFRF